ncbi:MAG: DUF4062 domain-containing protein [Bacteroidota bacterium]
MISSTVQDLREERKAVADAVGEIGLHRFRSETSGSVAASSYDVCVGMAENCDVMVLIIGERYGWVIPDLDISVTELEYNTARESDPSKILVYVKGVGSREPREYAFEAKVTDFTNGYFRASPFNSPAELGERVRDDVLSWLSARARKASLPEASIESLPTPEESRRELLGLCVGSAGAFLLMSLLFRLDPLRQFAVNTLDIWSILDQSFQFALLGTTSEVVVCMSIALVVGIGVTYGLGLFAGLGSRDVRKAKSVATIVLHAAIPSALALFFLLPIIFGIQMSRTIVMVGVLVSIYVFRSVFDLPEKQRHRPIRSLAKDAVERLLISPVLPNSVFAAMLTSLFLDYSIGSFSSARVGNLFRDSQILLEFDSLLLPAVALGVITFILRAILRSAQGHFAFSKIVLPSIRRAG